MDKSLEKIIEARKKQAVDRKLAPKISMIALHLGKRVKKHRDENPHYRDKFVFEYEELRIIEWSDGYEEGVVPINLAYLIEGNQERLVFESSTYYYSKGPSDNIYAYMPGKLERLLPDLYTKAVAEEKRKEEEKSREFQREQRENIR